MDEPEKVDIAERIARLGGALAGICGIVGVIGGLTQFSIEKFHLFGWNSGPTLETRITELTTSLNSASRTISQIETEIKKRQELVVKLSADADEAQKLKDLNASQVAAVAQALRGQLQEENHATFWPSLLSNLFFAAVGTIFGEVFRFARNFWSRKPTALSHDNLSEHDAMPTQGL